MAKIKFNLDFGGEQIRTLDDLRDNFSIEDVLDVYNNGLLVKWLDVHNHKDELEKVNAIQAMDSRSILKELLRIFGIEGLSEHNLFGEYDEIIQEIIENHLDLNHIYDCLDRITKNYHEILSLDYVNLFELLHKDAPDALYALLGHYATRPYYVLNDEELKICKDGQLLYPPIEGAIYHIQNRNIFSESGCSFSIFRPTDNEMINGQAIINDVRYVFTADEDILPSVKRKLYFANVLRDVTEEIFLTHTHFGFYDLKFTNVDHPYVKIFNGEKFHSETEADWHSIEMCNKVMLFYTTEPYTGCIKGMISGNNSHDSFQFLKNVVLTFPVFEGLNVKAEENKENYYNYVCSPFCYMEAR